MICPMEALTTTNSRFPWPKQRYPRRPRCLPLVMPAPTSAFAEGGSFDFLLPLSDHLVPLDSAGLAAGFDDVIPRLTRDGIAFGLLQGYQSALLFSDCPPFATPQPAGDATMTTPITITGTIVFPAGTPPGPPASVTIRLEDVSRADAPATILSSVTLDDVSVPPPAGEAVTFTLPVETFDLRASYTVRVHVDRDGDGQVSPGDLISTSHIPVLTQGGGTEVQIPVEIV